jgi:DNA invertase Pin-like site-specific DNA recombinase
MLAIYKRVSTEEQAEKGISLENQEYRGKELALKQSLEYKIYTDAGISGGKNIDQRPALKQMIADINKKVITAVFVLNQSRLDRGDIIQFTILKDIFKKNRIKLYFDTEFIDLTNINQEFQVDIQSIVNSFYLKQTKSAITSNLLNSVRKGKVAGGPFQGYGYTKDKDKMMVIDKTEEITVKDIYRLALQGKGTKVIANYLNESKVPTKRMTATSGRGMKIRGVKQMNFEWRDTTVYRILTNPLYKGERHYKEDIFFNVPAIIDETTFDLIQEQLKTRNQFKNTTNVYEYLLKGLILCPFCGSKIQGKKRANGKDNAYTCTSNRYGPNCGNRGINIEYLNELVVNSILDLENITKDAFNNDRLSKDAAFNRQQSSNSKLEITALEIEKDKIIDLVVKGVISEADTKGKLKKINSKIDQLQELVNVSEKQLLIVNEKDRILEITKEGIEAFKKLKSFPDKANFVQNIVSNITVRWDDELNVYDICIYFKINSLENYLIAKEYSIDRNSRKAGKALTKILSEKVSLQNILLVDDDNIVQNSINHINYGNHLII